MPDLHVYLFMVMENLMISGFVKAMSAAWQDARKALLASMPTRAASPPNSRIASLVSNPAPTLWHSSTVLTDAAYAMERGSIKCEHVCVKALLMVEEEIKVAKTRVLLNC